MSLHGPSRRHYNFLVRILHDELSAEMRAKVRPLTNRKKKKKKKKIRMPWSNTCFASSPPLR